MDATLQQAKRYAALKRTKVIEAPGGYRLHEDSITFVLESGPKLTFTGDELAKEITAMEKALARERAILEIDSADEPKKATPKPIVGAGLVPAPRPDIKFIKKGDK